MIEDIKVIQHYGWRYDVETQKWVWVATAYNLFVQKDGEWKPVDVEHFNPEPTEPPPADTATES